MGQPHANDNVKAKVARRFNTDPAFAGLVTIVYFPAALFVLLRHEIWRDEFGPWLFGRDSRSLADLLWNIRYEGHAPGWNIVVYAITRFTHVPEAMQIVHLLIATASVFLLLRYSPMPRVWKVLYAFGFYPFYQYAVVSRGYALCVLLLFAFCALYKHRRTQVVGLGLLLGLLAIADTYGWFIALSLSIGLMYSWVLDRRNGIQWTGGWPSILVAACIVGLGLAWSAIVSVPPRDLGTYSDWHLQPDLGRLWHVLRAFAFSLNAGSESIYIVGTGALFAALLLWFARYRVVFVNFAAFMFVISAFYYTKFDIVVFWHKGMVLEYIVACVWILFYHREDPVSLFGLGRLSLMGRRVGPLVIAATLIFYAIYTVKWVISDVRQPYTTGKQVAEYVEQNWPADIVVAGDPDFAALSIAGYMHKPMFYPDGDRFGTFILYDNKRRWPMAAGELTRRMQKLTGKLKSDVLLAVTYDLSDTEAAVLNARLIRRFEGSVVKDEDFRLYLIEWHPQRVSGSARER